jgi:hypothetical protein
MTVTYVEIDEHGRILQYGYAQPEIVDVMEPSAGGVVKAVDWGPIDPARHYFDGMNIAVRADAPPLEIDEDEAARAQAIADAIAARHG